MVKISFASIFFLLATLSSLSSTFPVKPRAPELASAVNAIVSVLDVVDVTVALVHIGRVEVDLVKDEATAIIEIVKGIVPNFEAALSAIVDQKKHADVLPLVPGPIAYSVLQIMDESTINLANSLIELVPSDNSHLVEEATCIKDQLQAAFKAASGAYASDY
ncbi:hypothetical protein F5887DRAFT_1071603 [Amanita rubescens]|nr:hypothetical protein F5887DRAFT_1071603 [Amanita rubescens]